MPAIAWAIVAAGAAVGLVRASDDVGQGISRALTWTVVLGGGYLLAKELKVFR